jgi:hypothetical protein
MQRCSSELGPRLASFARGGLPSTRHMGALPSLFCILQAPPSRAGLIGPDVDRMIEGGGCAVLDPCRRGKKQSRCNRRWAGRVHYLSRKRWTMFWRRFLLISATAACGVVSPVWAQVTTIPASFTREYVFPPVGLASSETASITLVNTAAAVSPTGASVTPAPSCTGTISFSSAKGEIGTPTPFTVASGQFMTVTLPFASAGLSGIRGEIQGNVSLTISTSAPTPCSLVASMETYDSVTGVTHAVLSSSLANLAPVGPVGPILPLAVPALR